MEIKRVILIVMDSVGAGEMEDAGFYNDKGADTLGHIYEKTKVNLPNLCRLGLGKIAKIGCEEAKVTGSFGRLKEVSPGKDTTSGHWELAGLELDFAFPTYPEGFPREIMEEFEKRIGTKTIGNYPFSGTEILKKHGKEHVETGFPIVYTSADSVFQIACHEEIVPLEKLYEYCRTARKLLTGEHSVGRVIARPFTGEPGNFRRDNAARRDFSLQAPEKTLLDILKEEGFMVTGIGKIGDIFAHRGLTKEIHTDNNMDGVDKTLKAIKESEGRKGLIFVNLVEFDSVYGHRRDIEGYAKALKDLDLKVPELMSSLNKDDVLVFTADHGCDPSHTAHTDHTREYVPLLVSGAGIKKGYELKDKKFSDLGQTVADMLGCSSLLSGNSFLDEILI